MSRKDEAKQRVYRAIQDLPTTMYSPIETNGWPVFESDGAYALYWAAAGLDLARDLVLAHPDYQKLAAEVEVLSALIDLAKVTLERSEE